MTILATFNPLLPVAFAMPSSALLIVSLIELKIEKSP